MWMVKAGETLKGAADREPAGGAVEVGPLETRHFASSHPGVRREVQSGVQALRLGAGEEGGQLVGGPGPGDLAGRASVAGVGGLRHVRVHELTAHREVER